MSGTSLDGLDISGVILTFQNKEWSFEISCCESVPYARDMKNALAKATQFTAHDLAELDGKLGDFFGDAVKKFITKNNFNPDFISSHGHTVFHQPKKRLTAQIGSANRIHALTGVPVIYDFRSLDVQLGGQGAPLVPIGDALLFSSYDACLNLGGIANISYKKNERRIAYDVCAFNIIFNYYSAILGYDLDEGGKIAREGSINSELLNFLDSLGYYQLNGPKSLGFEDIEKDILIPLKKFEVNAIDCLRTFAEHFSNILADSVGRVDGVKNILVTGGGVFNLFFIELLKKKLSSIEIIIPDTKIIEFKESLVFALIGALRVRGEDNVLASVTGASRNSCSGSIIGVI